MTEDYYHVGGSIPFDKNVYVSRRADDDLFESLENGEFSYVFNSRQMGKSSLMLRVKEKLKKDRDILCIDYSLNNRPTDESNFYTVLIQKIKLKLKEIGGESSDIAVEQDREMGCNDLTEFFQKVLLSNKEIKIIIFIDEIDVLFDFTWRDNFFSLIRAYSENKAHSDKQEYRRLTFCLLGVATPSDLIKDNAKSPFNIQCKRIELEGLNSERCSNLEQGLKDIAHNTRQVIEWIIDWTGGQPFLMQKVCDLVVTYGLKFHQEEGEKSKLDELVKEKIIENGLSEEKDDPQHLRTIKKRLLEDEQVYLLLNQYQNILHAGSIESTGNYVEQKLRLSGLVVKKDGHLEVFNKIYKSIFNQDWIKEELDNIIPIEYREKKAAWKASSDRIKYREKSWLLYGEELKKAMEKKYNKSTEYENFIQESDRNIAEYRGEIALELSSEEKDLIITTVIDWTNRETTLWRKLKEIINQQETKDVSISGEWVNNLVEKGLLNDQTITDTIKEKIQHTQEENSFWLLVTYAKILSDQVKFSDLRSDIYTEADELLERGLVRKRYEHVQDIDTSWEVANKVYAEVLNQEYIEQHLPAFRFNNKLGIDYGKKFGLWLINQKDKYLLSSEEISDIIPKLDNQELYLEEHIFLIKSQIKICLN